MPQDARDPAEIGRAMAEALMAGLDALKQATGGEASAPLERQLRSGALAVEAMKQLLPGTLPPGPFPEPPSDGPV